MTKKPRGPTWFSPYAKVRADVYTMLASLLGQPPSDNLLKVLQDLQWDEGIPEGLDRSLEALRQASHDYPLGAMREEYDKLFVGLGSGEIVPYASWYAEKMIQSAPLASLRSDLILFGIVRQPDSRESEDHASALCECMALISREPNEKNRVAQAKFFQQHLAPWMLNFFKDLDSAKSARFYRKVALLGRRFLESEVEYFKWHGGAEPPNGQKESRRK